jgi:hypothetical protein
MVVGGEAWMGRRGSEIQHNEGAEKTSHAQTNQQKIMTFSTKSSYATVLLI